MLGFLLAAALTVSQPESFLFESGLEHGVKYEFDCRWAYLRNLKIEQDTRGYVSLEITDSASSGEILQATIDVIGLPANQEFYDQIELSREDFCVDIIFTRQDLELTEIKDWERVRDESILIIERYTAALVKNGLMQQNEAQPLIDSVSTKLETEELCLRYYADRISPYLAGYDLRLSNDEITYRDIEFPNPFGGAPLPGYERTFIADDPKTAKVIEYRTNKYLDTLGAMRALRPELAKLGYERDDIKLSGIEIEYWNSWSYDESRSLITTAYFYSSTLLPFQDFTEVRQSWELIKPEREED